MADLNSYEQECQRAELLGIQAPDKAEFERLRSERLEQEEAELEAAEAAVVEHAEEALRGTGGKLDELNSILSSTQQRLNRFKQTACGSLTNIFSRGGSLSGASGTAASMDASSSAAADDESAETVCERQPLPLTPPTAAQVSAAKAAKQLRMDNQLDKLDALISKADNAQIAMGEQTKQMRRMAK